MGRYGDIDYPRMTKTGLGLGLALFLFGAIGAKVALAVSGGAIPGWERTLFFDAEWLGIALVLFSPIIFGIVLPLTE
ncbi:MULTISPECIES: DUF7860 family protein [Haloferax]|jgi:hypothetical protein|uniref:Uncharacterized protein n=6 Tax=Haloferax TaxID=2251 RepID=D4GZH7_HALVD|nr:MULTISPECIES: hypothetical protein [Haloferax]ADE04766.1 uncharacterized protein HVO_0232 [Haloferax volcanii DS2]ELK49699.1 hypothetical protein D320_18342 [Haloferax sp. BAB-2207]ELY23924.1 hypothetical protein C498_19414 [Haloferax volcanii DS2]ELZ70853.1 hypothetical protein C456_16832 [Haloferax lucentense DSM 14919]ELZ90629.1 hypothetical protein C452_09466 [Haloferax alexandrinus JCM 10717]